jgi:hypothetical protein
LQETPKRAGGPVLRVAFYKLNDRNELVTVK